MPGLGRSAAARGPAPWVLSSLIAVAGGAAYVVLSLPSADLAAATYRSELFSRVGFTVWDDGWYGGHHLPGYSVLSPALGSLLGVHVLIVLAAVAAAALFAILASRAFDLAGARLAGAWFALGMTVGLLSGRVAFDLGMAIGLGSLLALSHGRGVLAAALAGLTSLASPVAGAFLALAGVTLVAAGTRRTGTHRRAGAGVALAALTPVLVLAVVFPEGGREPFTGASLWPLLGATLGAGALLAIARWRVLGLGAALLALASLAAYVIPTPVGANVDRLAPLLAGPLLAGAMWPTRRRLLVALAPLLVLWQLGAPVRDLASAGVDPAAAASYYAPVLDELLARSGAGPQRVEVPMTGAHWEADYIALRMPLARGWERQLDTRDAPLFYAAHLSAGTYRAWLAENAVGYVAVPDARLDGAGVAEARLVRRGLPYLREVWHSRHWRLYAVLGPTPLAQAPARLTALGPSGFTVAVPAAGRFLVRVRFTPYWALESGSGCVAQAAGGWTQVRSLAPGALAVGIRFSPSRIQASGPRCR